MFQEDLTAMFDETHGFAVSATIGTATLSVIFDDAFYAAPGEEVDIESSKPMATCKSVDVAAVKQLDEITINGTDYVVVGKQPDGTGITVLTLEEA